ncbi:MAG: DUF2953 domain-containing protein [Eubacteriales bacterium]|nr:DUF2953 domain-containing protein [Eubacteriales bacterium]
MNPYFWLWAVSGLLGAPLTVALHVSVGRETRFALRVLALGVSLRRVRFKLRNMRHRLYLEQSGLPNEPPKTSRVNTAALAGMDPALRRALLSQPFRRACQRALEWRALSVDVKVAFGDAARTALCCAAVSALMETAGRCFRLPEQTRLRVRADFDGHGAYVSATGIISVRLGSLLLVAGAFAASLAKEKAKGNAYAATSD